VLRHAASAHPLSSWSPQKDSPGPHLSSSANTACATAFELSLRTKICPPAPSGKGHCKTIPRRHGPRGAKYPHGCDDVGSLGNQPSVHFSWTGDSTLQPVKLVTTRRRSDCHLPGMGRADRGIRASTMETKGPPSVMSAPTETESMSHIGRAGDGRKLRGSALPQSGPCPPFLDRRRSFHFQIGRSGADRGRSTFPWLVRWPGNAQPCVPPSRWRRMHMG
jgi:hypothetical protein